MIASQTRAILRETAAYNLDYAAACEKLVTGHRRVWGHGGRGADIHVPVCRN